MNVFARDNTRIRDSIEWSVRVFINVSVCHCASGKENKYSKLNIIVAVVLFVGAFC